MEEAVVSPLYEALQAITGQNPPEFTIGKFSVRELTDEEDWELQAWCINNARPHWATGSGIVEAAETLVTEAVGNCNILNKEELDESRV